MRQKKDGVKITVSLEKAIFEKMEEFCKETGLSKTMLVQKALVSYIEKNREKED